MRQIALVAFLIGLLTLGASAQKRQVDPQLNHYRVIVLDRVSEDPKTHTRLPAHAAGTLGWVAIYSKTGKYCLVEYVSAKFSDFAGLRLEAASATADPLMMLFEKHQTKREDLQKALKLTEFKDVNLDKFYVRIP